MTIGQLREHRIELSRRRWQQGKEDRDNGKPCSSSNGSYLGGWYYLEVGLPEWAKTLKSEPGE